MLKEHGRFWWAEEKFPEGEIAPARYVNGVLNISDEGQIEIELDGLLPKEKGKSAYILSQAISPDRKIVGLLKNINKYIVAEDLLRSGGVQSRTSISFEKFSAMRCAVLDKKPSRETKIKTIRLPLSGYEDWLKSDFFPIKTFKRGFSIKREPNRDLRAKGEHGRIALCHHLSARSFEDQDSKGLFLNEVSNLNFTPKKAVTIDEASRLNELVQDFLSVLTGSEYRSNWPSTSFTNGAKGTIHYFRIKSDENRPEEHRCSIPFRAIESNFCSLFFSWLTNSKEHGPGIYLYLSTKRGVRAYTEQRFFSLISGLEALHRSTFGDQETDSYRTKLQRILADVKEANDRKWLQKRLKNAGAPSLETRLRQLFETLPIDFREDRLNKFCGNCARARNTLAHYGHIEKDDDPETQKIWRINEILSGLYHLLILSKIGVDKDIIKDGLRSFRFYSLRWHLEQSELIALIEKRRRP